MWTSVVTANQGGWTSIQSAVIPSSIMGAVGEPIGLLLALTYGATHELQGHPWTSVLTVSSGGWTSVMTSNV